MPPPLDLAGLFQTIEEICEGPDLSPLYTLVGTLEVARARCLTALGERMGQSGKASYTGDRERHGSQRVPDRWISAKEAASRLGISVRTLSRRSHLPPYSAFCIPQPRGFKVSEAGLEDFQRRARA